MAPERYGNIIYVKSRQQWSKVLTLPRSQIFAPLHQFELQYFIVFNYRIFLAKQIRGASVHRSKRLTHYNLHLPTKRNVVNICLDVWIQNLVLEGLLQCLVVNVDFLKILFNRYIICLCCIIHADFAYFIPGTKKTLLFSG
jgi:hypothetical protein